MGIDLSTYKRIGTALTVKIEVDEYRTTSNENLSYSSQVLTFSDSLIPLTVDGQLYLPLGELMSISSTSNELRSSASSLTLSITGVPTQNMQEILNSKFKGSPVSIHRVIFDPATYAVLNIEGNPAGRFFGVIDNFNIEESWDQANRTSSLTIGFECTSTQAALENKLSGRKCNSTSHRAFYPNDPSMDRVTALAGANFDFGAKR
jgi:hypothetical protein